MTRLTVFGAGGRAGRAITAEALRRGLHVTAVVRDPRKHAEVAHRDVTLAAGDVTDPASVESAARGADAVVHAVSPFTGPEQGFADLDPRFFVRSSDALRVGMAAAGVERLLVIGLFANLRTADGVLVMDDPALFPPEIRPFARAHTDGLDRLRETAGPDWLVLTPPARLTPDAPRTGRYRLLDESLPLTDGELSYADLAIAVVDEAQAPTRHRTRVAVVGGEPARRAEG
ncbi:NAD(P)H-binding protein [Yinghuangia sp. ASG 101]|uniref:NAD(P)-dependent oxidoreductase n=1 Tax=Yinghuangia sp. ASG 101 TaxID=2896848 RepID=UPI001E5CEA6E|nr:NAD(P)H-binding protein [Yinghuangia sp. ASG 101]UGQ10611.1 NAD(P)H-binding protein [Yinghuangia sp. ASG 101]